MDLGASCVRVFVKGQGTVLREPSVVAFSQDAEVEAVGREAMDLLERTPTKVANVTVVRPLRDGVIADDGLVGKMLHAFLSRVGGGLLKPDIIMSVSSSISQEEKHRLLREVQASAHKVFLLEPPLAAALGAGVNVAEPTHSMIVHVGGSATDIAMLSRGRVVAAETLRVAGHAFDEAIVRAVRRRGVLTGDHAAEALKLELGAALTSEEHIVDREIDREADSSAVRGRDLTTGAPKTAHITAEEVGEALRDPLLKIVRGVGRSLEAAPPERVAEVLGKGILLTGGSAPLRHLDTFLQRRIGVPVTIVDQSADCVAVGIGRVFEQPELQAMLLAHDSSR